MIVLFVFGYVFYKLAFNFDKTPWVWALIGAGTYIVTQLLFSFFIGILYGLNVIPEVNEIVLTLFIVAVSSGAVYLLYRYMKSKWEKEDTRFDVNAIDGIGDDKN